MAASSQRSNASGRRSPTDPRNSAATFFTSLASGRKWHNCFLRKLVVREEGPPCAARATTTPRAWRWELRRWSSRPGIGCAARASVVPAWLASARCICGPCPPYRCVTLRFDLPPRLHGISAPFGPTSMDVGDVRIEDGAAAFLGGAPLREALGLNEFARRSTVYGEGPADGAFRKTLPVQLHNFER